MVRSRRSAVHGVLAVAAFLALLSPLRAVPGVSRAEGSPVGSSATEVFGFGGGNLTTAARLLPLTPQVVERLAGTGAVAALLAFAAFWGLVASMAGHDATVTSVGTRWRRRGPPLSALPA